MSGVDLLPDWPTSGDSEAAFNVKADALGPALATMITQINTALGVTNISAWVSGAAYTAGTSVVWSLIDFRPYRRKTTSSAGTTDPSLDTTNWAAAYPSGTIGNYAGTVQVTASGTLVAASVGKVHYIAGSSITATLPSIADVPDGATYPLKNANIASGTEVTINTTGGQTIYHNATGMATFRIPPGMDAIVTAWSGIGWVLVGGSVLPLMTGQARYRLQANITLYVSTTGSDSNNGLTVGAPFATIQKAWSTLQNGYDLNGYVATIQLADGTYTAGLNAAGHVAGQVSASSVVLNGNAGSPANVVINTTGANCVQASALGGVTVQNLKVQSTSNALQANAGGLIKGGVGLIFGTVSAGYAHIVASGNGVVNMGFGYTISAGAGYHFYASLGGVITLATGTTVTLSGTPAFGTFFAIVQDASRIYPVGVTFSGAATGTRYSVTSNGVINTNGAGASFLPGSVAGSTATGGQYV